MNDLLSKRLDSVKEFLKIVLVDSNLPSSDYVILVYDKDSKTFYSRGEIEENLIDNFIKYLEIYKNKID